MSFDNIYFYNFLGIVFIIMLNRIRNYFINSQKDILIFLGYFFSVTFHELTHFLVSLITFGYPAKFSILPYKTGSGWVLGYVQSNNINFINAPLIGLAPLLLLPFGYYIYLHFFNYFNQDLSNTILFYFLLYIVLSNSLPSTQDIKVALSYPIKTILFYISLAGLIFYFKRSFYD